MSNYQKCVDNDQLVLFLNEQLDERDESTVLEHINECGECQRALERIAAGNEAWSDLKVQLADHLDLDVTCETAPFQHRDRDIEMEKLKEYLGPTDDPNMLGRLGIYEVFGLVGRGSTGVVVKALDTRLNRYVAIKVLSPSFSSNGPARTRFEREGRSIAAVSHEHVVPIHSVNEYRGLPFIVMHYVDGGSLHQRIEKDGPLETCEIVRIGMQIARGLAAAHAQGIIHRDVKPANVMLETGVDRAMVSDFGLARVADEAAMTRSGVIAGTPQYMSPEQAMGDPIDPRSDLFSLGSVLYAACTGRAPFRSETVFGVIKRVCESTPRPIREMNPSIAPWLEGLISKLHEKDREDRFESAEQVADILNHELAHLQSPTFVSQPDRPWFVNKSAVNSKVPLKVATGNTWRYVLAAATVLVLATIAGAFVSGVFTNSDGSPEVASSVADGHSKGNVIKRLAMGPEDDFANRFATNKYRGMLKGIDSSKPYPWLGGEVKENQSTKKFEITYVKKNSNFEDDSTNKAGVLGIEQDCKTCESECSTCENDCESKMQVLYGNRGIAGRLVAVENDYPGDVVDGYLVYLPISYDKTKRDYPVIMFLTGGCGVGGEISNLKCWCLPKSIQQELQKDEIDLEDEHKKLMMDSFIVVAPHMKGGSFETRQFFDQEKAISQLLDEIHSSYRADKERVYLTGAGRGGHGTWGLAARMPDRFAAIAPLRGMRFGINSYQAVSDIPMWIGHNVEDNEVEFEETEEIVNTLTEYDGKEFLVIEEEDASGTPYLKHSRILTSYEGTQWPDLYTSAPLYKWFLNRTSKDKYPASRETVSIEKPITKSNGVVVTNMTDSTREFTVISKADVVEKGWRKKLKKHLDSFDDFESNIEKSIPVQTGGKLLLKTHLGHINITRIETNEVRIKVIRKVAAESKEKAEEIFQAQRFDFDLEKHGLRTGRDAALDVNMDPRAEQQLGDLEKGGIQFRLMEFEIGVPKQFDVDVETAAGHISTADIGGKAELKTSGGHIEMTSCSDAASLYTSGGHLTIGEVKGNLNAKTSGGHIKVKKVSGNANLDTSGGNIGILSSEGSIQAYTSGGNIEVVLDKQPKKDVVLSTSAGNVKIGIKRDLDLDVKAQVSLGTIGGSVIKANGKKKTKVDFALNGGGPLLKANSSIGSIEMYFLDSKTEK